MNTLRVALIAFVAALASACSSAPSKPVAPITSATPAVANIAGNWVLAVDTPNGLTNLTMSVVQTATSVSAKITDSKGTYDYDGVVNGNDIKFGHDSINIPGMRIEFIGTVVADAMKGKAVFGSFGEGTFTAKRQ